MHMKVAGVFTGRITKWITVVFWIAGLARLQAPEERPLGDAERPRGLDVEASRARKLDERVGVRGHPVHHLDCEDAVVAAVE